MAQREHADRITVDNWRTSVTPRCSAGMWMGAYVDEDENGFFGVWGRPGTWGHTVRCKDLEDAIAWVNCEPQPFAVVEIALAHDAEEAPKRA